MESENIDLTDFELTFLNQIVDGCISQFKSGSKDQIRKLKANIETSFKIGLTDFKNNIKKEDKIRDEFKKVRNDFFMTCPITTEEDGRQKLNDILNDGLKSKIKSINKKDLSAAEILSYSNKFAVLNLTNIPTKNNLKSLFKFTLPNSPLVLKNSIKIYASECLFIGLASLDKNSGINISRSIPTCAKKACTKLNEIAFKIRKSDLYKTKLTVHNFRYKLQLKKRREDNWTDLTDIDTLTTKYSQDITELSEIAYIPYSPKNI